MPTHRNPRWLRHQSQLSVAVVAVFCAGGLFATLTAVLFPPTQMWSWPNPYMIAAATFLVALLVFIRGRRLKRLTAACITGAFVVSLLISASLVDGIERAVAAGLLIIGVSLVFAWFMPAPPARVFGYTSLLMYGIVLLRRFPESGTLLIVLAISALSILLTEVFGNFKRQLQRASLTDHLCQVWNRAGFELMLKREIRTVARTHEPLSLLYLDLDGFKNVNDSHGHLAGDRVLQQLSRSLEGSVRAGDTVARIGGDEFALILPRTTAAEARVLGVRLREEVTDCEWSFGEAEYRTGESAQEFINRSDIELVEWKQRRKLARRERR